MREKIGNAVIELLKIKSIVTIAVLIVFVQLAVTKIISAENSFTIILAVIMYYFNKNEKKIE